MAKYALVVGISQYKSFKNLPKAAADAEAVANLLEQHHYEVTRLPARLVDENTWKITSDDSLEWQELNDKLKIFLLQRAENHEVVIYFAGHGFQVTNATTEEEEGYLATTNFTEKGGNAIQLIDLNTLVGKSKLSSLVMLLDCCYAGTLLDRKILQPLLMAFNQNQNYQLITACRDFEKAREGLNHGILAWLKQG